MKFIHYEFKNLTRGQTIEVTLSAGANVRLMNTSNYNQYRSGRRHSYYGGLAKRSPFRLVVPHSGNWHVTVDTVGLRNGTKASARVLPGPLPEARDPPLASVPSLLRQPSSEALSNDLPIFDVFISHASEDKNDFVRPLASALQAEGLTVWYDEFTLRIGDSLRQKIDQGLARSRVGIVVLSESFFSKGWTNYELDGIVSRSLTGEQQLLPIWHKVSKADVMRYSPSLVDKVARSTSLYTPAEIAAEIAKLVYPNADAQFTGEWDE